MSIPKIGSFTPNCAALMHNTAFSFIIPEVRALINTAAIKAMDLFSSFGISLCS